MASVILGSLGSAVGGPFGKIVGGIIGGVIDGWLFSPAQDQEGPRLDSLKVQNASYGTAIPRVFGSMRVSGNMIWSTDLEEIKKTESAKGGPEVTTYTYYANFAVAVCEGPITNIKRIWADTKVIYEDGAQDVADSIRIYTGDEEQLPDSLIQSFEGIDNTPGYRGVAYVVFERMALQDFGNRIPNLTFEVVAAGSVAAVSQLDEFNTSVSPTHHKYIAASSNRGPFFVNGDAFIVGNYESNINQLTFERYTTTNDILAKTLETRSLADTGIAQSGGIGYTLSPDGAYIAITTNYFNVGKVYAVNTATGVWSEFQPTVLYGATVIFWISERRFACIGQFNTSEVFEIDNNTITSLGALTGTNGSVWDFCYQNGITYLLTNKNAGSNRAIRPVDGFVMGTAVEIAMPGWENISTVSLTLRQAGSGLFLMSGGDAIGGTDPARIALVSYTGISAEIIDELLIEDNAQSPFVIQSTDTRFFILQDTVVDINGIPTNTLRYRILQIVNNQLQYQTEWTNTNIYGETLIGKNAIDIDNARAIGFSRANALLIQMTSQSENAFVQDIMSSLLERAKVNSSQYDVSQIDDEIAGFVIDSPMPTRNAIEVLMAYSGFDMTESQGKLKAIPRSNDVDIVIDENKIGANENEASSKFEIKKRHSSELPREFVLEYADTDRDYQAGVQRASRRIAESEAASKATMPVAMNAKKAKAIAENRLFGAWIESRSVTGSLPFDYLELEPGDVIKYDRFTIRLTKLNTANGVLNFEGVPIHSAYKPEEVDADTNPVSGVYQPLANSMPIVMDIPPLRSKDNKLGGYIAAASLGGRFPGCAIYSDDDQTFVDATARTTLGTGAIYGYVANPVPAATAEYIDYNTKIIVNLQEGELFSVSEEKFFNGHNVCLIGNEIFCYQYATLVEENSYELSKLLRGRLGTEWAISGHTSNEMFVNLSSSELKFVEFENIERNRLLYYRSITLGQTLSDAAANQISQRITGMSLRPFSPAHAVGTRSSVGDLIISWKRRARIDGEWLDDIDAPLEESTERYEIDILSDDRTIILRTVTLSTPYFNYTASMQLADFGTLKEIVQMRIFQISNVVGRGKPLGAAL